MIANTSITGRSGWLGRTLIIVGAWAALSVMFTFQFVLLGSLEWIDAVKLSSPFWVAWAVLLPLVIWLAFRFPLVPQRFTASIPAHLVGCALVVGVGYWSAQQFGPRPGLGPPPGSPRGGLGPRGADRPPPFLERGGPPENQRPRRQAIFRATSDLLLYWLIVSVCTAIASLQGSQERERRAVELEGRLASARLQALRMQLQPHFLFNTLNALSTLVHTDPRAADEMVTNLSGLLRASLETADEQEVPLRRELDLLRLYLDIEQARFGDRLRVELDLAPDTLTALVPTLILQPLVENAIRHGLEPQTGPGQIVIRSRHRGEHLRLSVADNGPGVRSADTSGETSGGRRGIGLANTRDRLQALYGPVQRLSIGNEPGGGCLVEIELPFHSEPLSPTAPEERSPA